VPLDLQTLTQGLRRLDEPTMPLTAEEVVERWFNAWWGYVHLMSFYNPGAVSGGRQPAHDVFRAALLPFCHVNYTPITFFLALEQAARQSLLVLGTPAYLAPGMVISIPTPNLLAPQLVQVVPIGLSSSDKTNVRQRMALIIDTWTRTNLVQPTPPAPPLPYV
jgi:hypothetical protein